ncbi:hypothetical protein BTI_1865 [Burkholderia thailandensis MSMB121]|nr:hypothetical protein BTI_1865 [Burkholderia thailandensis MSMB121]KST76023.1 hypothetical protein WS76_09065 [Burkholderia humptydooensis]
MKRRRGRGVLRWLPAFAVACVLASGVPAAAQTADVPQPWIRYGELAGGQFRARLEAEGEAADRLHRYLAARVANAGADAPMQSIVVRAWMDANGAVTRVEFASLGDPDADATLRQLLTATPLAEPPPPDMPQPLRVRLRFAPNPESQTGEPAETGHAR